MKLGKGANADPRISLMRGAKTRANYRCGMGGLPRTGTRAPPPITLPKMPWDDEPEATESEND